MTFTPFDEAEGMGILLGIHVGGFNVDILLHGPAEGGTRYQLTAKRMPPTGKLVQQISDHARAHLPPHAARDLRLN